MKKLITKTPKRLFTFGCSFTSWRWPTWAHIIAYELSIPLYNYGKAGAGNQYIFNMLMQADNFYNFNEDDLVIINWTNISREDRYKDNEWITPGNIYTQNTYDKSYIKKWTDEKGYAIRDLAIFKAAWDILINKKCQFHFLKVLDFNKCNLWESSEYDITNIINFYEPYLLKIEKSFFEVLWNNNFNIKIEKEKLINPIILDGHPDIQEHLLYLKNIFDYTFSSDTENIVNLSNNNLNELLRKQKQNNYCDFPTTYFKVSEEVFSLK